MKSRLIPAAAAILCFGSVLRLPAQSTDSAPKVLVVVQERSRMPRKEGIPAHYLGLTSEAGESESWFLEPYDSFGDMEKARGTEGEVSAGSRVWLAAFREDLSYHAAEGVSSLPKCRHLAVTVLHVQYGHDGDLAQAARLLIDANERSMSGQPVLTYLVVSGGPSGLYLLFSPMPSLGRMDEAPARAAEARRLMGEHNRQRFDALVAGAIASSETRLFALDPRMSHVSKEFAEGDPEFWNVAPEPEAKPKSRR